MSEQMLLARRVYAAGVMLGAVRFGALGSEATLS